MQYNSAVKSVTLNQDPKEEEMGMEQQNIELPGEGREGQLQAVAHHCFKCFYVILGLLLMHSSFVLEKWRFNTHLLKRERLCGTIIIF